MRQRGVTTVSGLCGGNLVRSPWRGGSKAALPVLVRASGGKGDSVLRFSGDSREGEEMASECEGRGASSAFIGGHALTMWWQWQSANATRQCCSELGWP
jgi:hypothetical protein